MNNEIRQKIDNFFAPYKERHYEKGSIITHANEPLPGILYLKSGVVEQYELNHEGNRIALNTYKPGAFFPMSWAINKVPNEYFFEATEDVQVCIADPEETINFLKNNPDVLFDLMSRVYKGTDGLLRRFALARNGIAIERLIYELLLECYRFGNQLTPECYKISITQNKLSHKTGLARETISRELKILQDSGDIRSVQGGYVIDAAKLKKRLGGR